MIQKTSNFGLIFGLFLALLPVGVAYGEGPVIRTGETVSVESNQVLEGDFYALGQAVTISGEAERDVYTLGQTVTINAPVTEDLVVIGDAVQVHGEVKDDVRVVGREVTIAQPVHDDLVVIGGVVRILSTASIGGDLIFLGGDIQIDGPVAGTVYGTAEQVRIDAHVGGDVTVRAGSVLTLGDRAEIIGSLNYKSVNELTRGQGAVVTGPITHDNSLFEAEETNPVQSLVFNMLVLVFSSLTLFFILRTRTHTFIKTIEDGYGRLGLIGLGMLLAIPVVSIILMSSLIGFVVGFVMMLAYIVLMLIAFMCLPIFFGALLQRLIRLGDTITVFTVILGVFVVIGLPYVPFLGVFVILLGFLMILGGLYAELYRLFKAS